METSSGITPAGGPGTGPYLSGSSSAPAVDLSKIHILWDGSNSHRTDRLVTWLQNNQHHCGVLFPDLFISATPAGKNARSVNRTARQELYAKIAHEVFSNDPEAT